MLQFQKWNNNKNNSRTSKENLLLKWGTSEMLHYHLQLRERNKLPAQVLLFLLVLLLKTILDQYWSIDTKKTIASQKISVWFLRLKWNLMSCMKTIIKYRNTWRKDRKLDLWRKSRFLWSLMKRQSNQQNKWYVSNLFVGHLSKSF